MPLSFSEELLSAYLDGEVTPEEKQYVQRLLEEQPELQHRLGELTEVSLSVRELPREPAPEDFSRSIMGQLTIPAETSATLKVSIAKRKRFRFRQLASMIVAMGVILVVGLVLYQNPMHKNRLANQDLSSDLSTAEMSMEEGFSSGAEEVALPEKGDAAGSLAWNGALPDLQATQGMPTLELKDLSAAPTDRSESFALAGTTHVPKVVNLDRKTIQKHLSSLGESPSVGEELSILTSRGDAPILVDFTVVDVQKSLGTLQILLKNHSVKQLQFNNREIVNANDKLVAVYLDLEEPELENVLNQVAALDATIITGEQAWLTSPQRLGLQDSVFENQIPLPTSPPQMKRGNSTTMNPLNDGLAFRAEPPAQSPVTSPAPVPAQKKSVARSDFLPQNYHFDFDSVRNLNRNYRGGRGAAYSGLALEKANTATTFDIADRLRPPTPLLPEKIEDQNARQPGAVNWAMSNRPSVSNEPAQSLQAPSENTDQVPIRIRALLILREENESENSQ